MKTRAFLMSGWSRLWLGCNAIGHIPGDTAARLVGAALDCGITCFDTANVYANGASETELGRLLPRDPSAARIITKFGHPASVQDNVGPCSPKQVTRAAEASLRRLRRERIDVFMIHFPDPQTPYAATLEALQHLIEAGKIAHYAVSNFDPDQMRELLSAAQSLHMPPPLLAQGEYSLLRRERAADLLPFLERESIAFVPFFPLASGLLTDKDRREEAASLLRTRIVRGYADRFLSESNSRKVEALRTFCAVHDVAMVALALHWLDAQPSVAAILAGASNADQVRANVAALRTGISAALLREAEALLQEIEMAER